MRRGGGRRSTERRSTSESDHGRRRRSTAVLQTFVDDCMAEGEHRRRRARVLRHATGGRGSRGGAPAPRRRSDDAVRRELRNAVRADIRRCPSRATSPALDRRRRGRPDDRRADVVPRGRPRPTTTRSSRHVRGVRRRRGVCGRHRRRRRRRHGRRYDDLAARLADGPIDYEFPMPDGSTETPAVDRRPTSRSPPAATSVVQRSDAPAARAQRRRRRQLRAARPDGRPVPSTSTRRRRRCTPIRRGRTPSTTPSNARTTRSTPAPAHRVSDSTTWIDAHLANGDDELRLGGVALGDMPCLYWPSQPGEVERPEPIVDPPYPTFVLTSDTDPATPTVNAMRVFSRLDDAYLIAAAGRAARDLRLGLHVRRRPHLQLPRIGHAAADEGDDLRRRHHRSVRARPLLPRQPTSKPPIRSTWPPRSRISCRTTSSTGAGSATRRSSSGATSEGRPPTTPTDEGVDVTLDECEFTDGYPVSATGAYDVDGILSSRCSRRKVSCRSSTTARPPRVDGTWNDEPVTSG